MCNYIHLLASNNKNDERKVKKMQILEINQLSKQFTNVKALDNISFGVDRGSITGILGPNGAGKTTLLRIINGIITSDSGSVLVDGKPASRGNAALIGYMPEERGLYDNMTVENQIVYFGMLKGGQERRIRNVMAEYLELFNLKGQHRRKIKELSKGNQQKVQIISTLVHEPQLVILDEPFSGFDPINGAILTQVIERLQGSGTTIILSSHNMAAIENMCSDIALINRGHLLIKDSIENIKEKNRDNSLLVTSRTPIDIESAMASGAITDMNAEKPGNWRKGFAYRLKKKEETDNGEVIQILNQLGNLTHFEEALPSLNEIFLKYTVGTLADE